ncbi:uncharacterized protein [Procambarus clarkii]|uniref:uncharacterized protein n=1 Tax=Procambarus clarkii TaxID=6728 RepID=UPI0037448586
MACSLKNIVNCGLVLAVFDLLHGLATTAFYSYQFASHYNCHWNHGIRWCQYYLHETNHSLRVNLGIGEGIVCLVVSCLLMVALCKYNPVLTWLWLVKAVAVLVLNTYFLTGWVLQKSSHYHQFWDRHNYDQDNIFLLAGAALTFLQLLIMFIFCCVTGSFTCKVHKQRIPTMETDI